VAEPKLELRNLIDLNLVAGTLQHAGELVNACFCLRDSGARLLCGSRECGRYAALALSPVNVDGVTIAEVWACPHTGADGAELAGPLAEFVGALAMAGWWRQRGADLQARLVEEIKINAELEEALRVMELRALQSQINPHFLFNTLATIAAQAVLEDARSTQELVHALARLLRYSLRRIGEMVDLADELNHVRDYLVIQKARFGKRVEIHIDADEDVLQAQIPLLTLQPLVENAIIHGFESRDSGLLQIRAAAGPRGVEVQVIDDGVGIPPARLADIRALRDVSTARGHTTGLGVHNVHRRLQYQFGEEYGVDIKSAPGQGTRATVTIPFSYREEREPS